MPHPIVHLEIPTTDITRSAAFYRKLFDWTIDHSWGPDYALFSYKLGKSEGLTGGGLDRKDKIAPGNITIYIQVDDIEAMLEKAVRLGATKVEGKTEIPNTGWFGLFKDLDGNTIGLFKPKK